MDVSSVADVTIFVSARGVELLTVSIRSRGGCLALVPKSPVHSGIVLVGGYTFVSRPSRSTSHPASRRQAVCFLEWLDRSFLRGGGPPCPPVVSNCLSLQCARVVGASRSCRSRRYTVAPFLSVATLSSPGPHAQHPTPHRDDRLVTWF